MPQTSSNISRSFDAPSSGLTAHDSDHNAYDCDNDACASDGNAYESNSNAYESDSSSSASVSSLESVSELRLMKGQAVKNAVNDLDNSPLRHYSKKTADSLAVIQMARPRSKSSMGSEGSSPRSTLSTASRRSRATSASSSSDRPAASVAAASPSKRKREYHLPVPRSEPLQVSSTPNRPIMPRQAISEPPPTLAHDQISYLRASPGLIDAIIKTMLREPLSTHDFKACEYVLGSVYVYEDRHRPGCYKIGYTADEPEIRIRTACSREPRQIFKTTKFKCAYLAEQIIHKELANFQDKAKCSRASCAKVHREWFKVDKDDAIKIITRWESFMKSAPHDCNGNLTVFWKDRLKSMHSEEYTGDAEEALASQRERWKRTLNPTAADLENYFWSHERISKTRSDLAREHWKLIPCLGFGIYISSSMMATDFRILGLHLLALGQAVLVALFVYWRLMLSLDVDILRGVSEYLHQKLPR